MTTIFLRRHFLIRLNVPRFDQGLCFKLFKLVFGTTAVSHFCVFRGRRFIIFDKRNSFLSQRYHGKFGTLGCGNSIGTRFWFALIPSTNFIFSESRQNWILLPWALKCFTQEKNYPLEWDSSPPLVTAVLITLKGAESPDSGHIGVIGALVDSFSHPRPSTTYSTLPTCTWPGSALRHREVSDCPEVDATPLMTPTTNCKLGVGVCLYISLCSSYFRQATGTSSFGPAQFDLSTIKSDWAIWFWFRNHNSLSVSGKPIFLPGKIDLNLLIHAEMAHLAPAKHPENVESSANRTKLRVHNPGTTEKKRGFNEKQYGIWLIASGARQLRGLPRARSSGKGEGRLVGLTNLC